MRRVVVATIGAVMLLLAGMLASNAVAARLTGCCHIGGMWLCGSPPPALGQDRLIVASCTVLGIVPVLRHHIRVTRADSVAYVPLANCSSLRWMIPMR
jgi:hypothetical protein